MVCSICSSSDMKLILYLFYCADNDKAAPGSGAKAVVTPV